MQEEPIVENQENENEVEALKKEIETLDNKYKRALAEFDNLKKRSAKDRENLYNTLICDIFKSILPVVDNLEKATSTECKDEEYKKGIVLLEKQLKDVLTANNVEEIKCEGQKFDPELHEAVSMVQDENLGEKEIKEVFRKGYKVGNKVIRHSMVIVAN